MVPWPRRVQRIVQKTLETRFFWLTNLLVMVIPSTMITLGKIELDLDFDNNLICNWEEIYQLYVVPYFLVIFSKCLISKVSNIFSFSETKHV